MVHCKKDAPIGIFDSGLGGVSCLGQGMHMLPREKFIYFGDSGVSPYSLMPKAEVKELCFQACDFLVGTGVKAIVVACNTATSVAVAELRQKYTIPILGMEPALKVAIDFSLEGTIIVMATGMTLNSRMMDNLIARFGQGSEIVKLPCRDVITLVESGIIDGPIMAECLGKYFAEFNPDRIASVVFGCTHYGFLEKPLKKVLGEHIRIADGNEGTIRHLKHILKDRDLLNDGETGASEAEIYNSGGPEYIDSARKLLSQHLANLKAGRA